MRAQEKQTEDYMKKSQWKRKKKNRSRKGKKNKKKCLHKEEATHKVEKYREKAQKTKYASQILLSYLRPWGQKPENVITSLSIYYLHSCFILFFFSIFPHPYS